MKSKIEDKYVILYIKDEYFYRDEMDIDSENKNKEFAKAYETMPFREFDYHMGNRVFIRYDKEQDIIDIVEYFKPFAESKVKVF